MKNNIHPQYEKVTVTCTGCGAEFETGSTKKMVSKLIHAVTVIHFILVDKDSQ